MLAPHLNPTPGIRHALVPMLLLLLLQACSDKEPKSLPIPSVAFAPYVSSFSSGLISNTEPLEIILARPVSGMDLEAEIPASLLKIEPKVKGTLEWEGSTKLRFSPSEPWPSNQGFVATLQLDKLIANLPDSLHDFSFGFFTRPQGYQVEELRLRLAEDGQANHELYGSIKTFDGADPQLIERAFHAEQKGQSLEVLWSHQPAALQHDFVLSGLSEFPEASDISLHLSEDLLATKAIRNAEVQMLPADSFGLLLLSTKQQMDEQVIYLSFSDLLDPDQDLNGLIRMEGQSFSRLDIDGNLVTAYIQGQLEAEQQLFIDAEIRNINGQYIGSASQHTLQFEALKPALQLVGDGVIVPSSEGSRFPFKAINLKAVDVKVIRIFSSNVQQFLEYSGLDADYASAQVGRVILEKEVMLRPQEGVDMLRWNHFALDLEELLDVDPGAIYRIELSFRKNQTIKPCPTQASGTPVADDGYKSVFVAAEDGYQVADSYGYEEEYWNNAAQYEADDYNNPCHDAFYGYWNTNIASNFLASDIGLIAKAPGQEGGLLIAASSLIDTEPISGLDVEVYDLQKQLIVKGKTDADGFARLHADRIQDAHLLIARKGSDISYLKVEPGSALNVSAFDVKGNLTEDRQDVFFYGERGVWRPGDSIYLMMWRNAETLGFGPRTEPGQLPRSNRDHEGHAVARVSVFNPQGSQIAQFASAPTTSGLYDLRMATSADAPTGVYRVEVALGGKTYPTWIRVESIKPNRLTLQYGFPQGEQVLPYPEKVDISARWLQGPQAAGYRAVVELSLQGTAPPFSREGRFRDYSFSDNSRQFAFEKAVVFDQQLNAEAQGIFEMPALAGNQVPGMLQAQFQGRVFEPGGDFSTINRSVVLSPYTQYVGIKIPDSDSYYGHLRSKGLSINVVNVDAKGKAVQPKQALEVQVYNLDWAYWWEQSDPGALANFIANRSNSLAIRQSLNLNKGESVLDLNLENLQPGRKLLRIFNPESGHASSSIFYVSDPDWYYDAGDDQLKAAELLTFNLNASNFQVGQPLQVNLPEFKEGRALVSIENHNRVIAFQWVEPGDASPSFEVSSDMAPNAFVSVTLVQPHAQTANDQPIRMFGIQPFEVEDPSRQLEPQITISTPKDPQGRELSPESSFTVNVSEAEGRAMTYTLAVVEQGLLDLSSFETPNPFEHFNQRRGLGVRTYDLYKYVLSSFTAKLAGVMSIGGDQALAEKIDPRANRFKPVVKFLGPFELKPGARAKHELLMPNYIGSVKVMVVAGNGQTAFGRAEETRPVRRPLMVLASLPRVLSPGDQVEMPVTVFSMDPSITDVELKIDGLELLEADNRTAKVRFSESGEKLAVFSLRVPSRSGIATVSVQATGGQYKASDKIEIEVRAPNPVSSVSQMADVAGGQSWSASPTLRPIPGTADHWLEVSAGLPLNLSKRLEELIHYPYGCVEQVTSAAFPQLFVGDFSKPSTEQSAQLQQNVNAAISSLSRYQLASGAMGYWPESNKPDLWSSSYAMHFLHMAKEKGYRVPSTLWDKLLQFQRQAANDFSTANFERYGFEPPLSQAYRLMVLAEAGQAQIAAMNRLRSSKQLDLTSLSMLARAYAGIGQESAAKELINRRPEDQADRRAEHFSYGSSIRDLAIRLYASQDLVPPTQSFQQAGQLSNRLNSPAYMSTQDIGWALLAMHRFGKDQKHEDMSFSYAFGSDKGQDQKSAEKMIRIPLGNQSGTAPTLTFRNKGTNLLFVSLSSSGVPIPEANPDLYEAQGLDLNIQWLNPQGAPIDISALPQGQDFSMLVKVRNTDPVMRRTQLALDQMMPSGWEIRSVRFAGQAARSYGSDRHLDKRDDRVYSFFDLAPGEEIQLRIELNATFLGRYLLPEQFCGSMYDAGVYARRGARWVEVLKEGGGTI